MSEPKRGAVAYCGHNILGLITEDKPQLITYKDGTQSMSWRGVKLSVANHGDEWLSRNPKVVGYLPDYLIEKLEKGE